MVVLRSGIEITQELADAFLRGEVAVVWETHQHVPHPDMEEQQCSVVPVKINAHELPQERIAYYLVTNFDDDDGNAQELFAVMDSSAFVEAGRIEYSSSEQRTAVVETREEAEKMVLNVLRQFFRDEDQPSRPG